MTWGEFVKVVEKRGVKPEDPIWYIDLGMDWIHDPQFERDPLHGWAIW